MERDQIILINKPLRWTSFDVVRKVHGILKRAATVSEPQATNSKLKIKVGHAGTLDPLATGLLILCTGSLTKKISEIQNAEKEYTGSFTIGSSTPSYDLETELSEPVSFDHVTEKLIFETSEKFKGKQMQIPPAHSAVKVNGIRAYQKARSGQAIDLQPKEVFIKEFEISAIDLPRINIRVVCAKGTYIRSLAHDFGRALGCGAHLSALCRTRIGDYALKDSLTIEDFMNKYSTETASVSETMSF